MGKLFLFVDATPLSIYTHNSLLMFLTIVVVGSTWMQQ